MNSDSIKLYPIQSFEPHFHAGVMRNGLQAIMGPHTREHVVAFTFDAPGKLLSVRTRILPQNVHSLSSTDPERARGTKEVLEKWQQELGFERSRVMIQAFKEAGVGIDELPWHFQEFLRDPKTIEPDKSAWPDLNTEIQNWLREGRFVFWWGTNFWMDPDGSVESS